MCPKNESDLGQTLAKKLLAIRPEKVKRRKNKKKSRMTFAKLFGINASAITKPRQMKIVFLIKLL